MRNQWPIGKFLRCRNKGLLKLWGASRNEQMVVEVHMKWHQRIHAQMTQWTNEPMNQWMSELVSRWINECSQWIDDSANHWMHEMKRNTKWKWNDMKKWKMKRKVNGMKWMNERTTNEWIVGRFSMSQWINEAISQRLDDESINQWIDASTNMIQWINDPMIQWIKEPTYQCTSELLSRWFN
jgi:hypothetical protein